MANTHDDPIDFILAQVRSNVEFLEKKGRISADSARVIAEILGSESSIGSPASTALSSARTQVGSPPSSMSGAITRVPPPPSTPFSPPVARPAPAAPQAQYVRAIYNYNTPGDLAFKIGDVIELTPKDTDNDDWWTGKLNGITGIFPSNHVERVPTPGPVVRGVPPPPAQGQWNSEKPPLQSWNSAPAGPPGYNQYPGPPPQGPGMYQQQQPQQFGYGPGPSGPPPTVIVQQGEGDPNQPQKKKGVFGKYGGTLANSAAGGVGFGAGAAVGSGIINAIF